MKTIIAGSRGIVDYSILLESIKLSGFDISEVISGGAKGADYLGEQYAKENNIKLTRMPVTQIEYNKYGNRAYYLRNEDMAKCGECLIALWDGESNGTRNMIEIAKRKNLKIYVYNSKSSTK